MLNSTKAGQVAGTRVFHAPAMDARSVQRASDIARWLALFTVAAIAVVLLWPQSAQAACSGGACACGDFILSGTTNVVLTQDIGPCSGQYGLRVEAAVNSSPLTIDCQGHRIFSNNIPSATTGIVNAGGQGGGSCSSSDCRQNVTVKNCVIEGFDVGIDYKEAYGWNIEGNTITGRWDGTTVYPTAVGIRGWPGRIPVSPTLVIDNDILEVTDTGIDLMHPPAGSEIRGNRVTAYVLNKQSVPKTNAGIRLELPRGESGNRIQVRGNYVDCPTRTDYNSTECTYYDLFIYSGYVTCPPPGTWLGWVDVYDNVFSGKGVSIDCDPLQSDLVTVFKPEIHFKPPSESVACPTPAINNNNGLCNDACIGNSDYNDCQARYNIFTNAFPPGTAGGGCTAAMPANTCDPDCKMTVGADWDPDCVGIPRPFYYDADEFLKTCEAPSTWATTKVITENKCFQPGQTYTFKPANPHVRSAITFGDHSSKYGPGGPDVGLILDCNWEGKLNQNEDSAGNGKLLLDTMGFLPATPTLFATTTIGIAAQGTRSPLFNSTYTPRKRGTIVACETENFGTGILLENSQDFLLRWNIMRSIYNNNSARNGYFLNVKSDHVQDCDDMNYNGPGNPLGNGIFCELGIDGNGTPDPDPLYAFGVNVRDFRHQIYNLAYRPLNSGGTAVATPFNWVNAVQPFSATNNKQVLYFYGSGADGLTVDGTNAYFGNVGHLTAANVQRSATQSFTVQKYGGLAGGGAAIAGGDGVKFACVGMSRNDNTCSISVDPVVPTDFHATIDNVAVTGSQAGFYLFNSYRVALQNSRAGGSGAGNGYGVLMLGTANSTVGCAASNACPGVNVAPGCNCLQNNDEGLWAAPWKLPATKVLVWGNSVSDNTRDGVVLFDADQSTVQGNTIANTGGPCWSAGATVGCPAGFNPDAVGLYLYGAKDGNIYGNTVTNSDGDNVALVQSFNGRNSAAERNFLYSNTITNSLAGRGIYAYNSIPNVAGNVFGWATAAGLPCPTAPAWPNSPCTGFSTDVWPMNLAPGSYHTTISGNARGSGMKLAYTNFDRLYRNKIEGNADGLVLYQARILDAVENQIAANAGWGVVGWDENQNFLVRNQISRNGRGGMSFAAYETQGGLPDNSTALWSNVMDGNLGPGLQFNYALNFDVKGNRIKLPNTPSVPGVLVYNSQNVNLKGNTISSAAATPQFPYLTVSALPQSVRPVALPNVSGSEFYDHHIYQSNTAGPDSAVQTVTYAFQDGVAPTTGYNGTTDVTIDQTAPSANQNNVSYLEVDGDVQQALPRDDRRILLKWDISAIPSTCRVTGVSVTVFVPGSPADTTTPFGAYELKRAWIESGATGATWLTSGGVDTWQQAGADGSQDRDSVDLAYIDAAHNGFGKNTAGIACGLNSSCTNNLNAAGVQLVQDWVSTVKTNNGIIIMPNDGDADWNAFRFNRQETSSPNETQRPKLTVTCTMYPPVYYFYNNREHREDNTDVEPLAETARTVEKACLGNSLNFGRRCTTATEAADCNNGGTCSGGAGTCCLPLQTKHLQLAASTKFKVQNFTGTALNRLTGADPLRADYMAETNLTGLELADCLGPCLVLANSSGSGLVEFSLDNIVVSNPFGSGLVAAAGAGVTATNLRIVPGPGQIESNAIQLDDAGFGLGCPSGGCMTQLWNGLAGNTLTDLPGSPTRRNELVRSADTTNRFWELEAAGRTLGDITYTQFTNRGAFEVSCQPGKDDCCNATGDTVCDPDCGMNGSDPVDADCSAITSGGGNGCLAIVDGACDTDCPARVDPDCGMRAAISLLGNGCYGGGVADGLCDYECIQDSSITTDSQDPDCKLITCSSSKDGCCNPSDDVDDPLITNDFCDPDCTRPSMAGGTAIIDPDCDGTGSGLGTGDGCFPVNDSLPDLCDTDCPAGLDPDCGIKNDTTCDPAALPVDPACVANASGLPTAANKTADGVCNGVDDTPDLCDPDCLGQGAFGTADADCPAALCTFRPSFVPSNTFSSDGGCPAVPADDNTCDRDCIAAGTDPDCTEVDCCFPAVDGACDYDCPAGVDPDCIRPAQWPPIVATCQSWRDGMCDYDCPSITFPTESPPVSGCNITINQICDPDCIGVAIDPDCLQPDPDCPAALAVKLPAGGACNAVQDGLCDQACAAGLDPDCGVCGLPQPQGAVTFQFQAPDGRCDADCGLNDKYGIPYDPDCGYCGSGQDGCCYAFNEYTVPRCDPDCGMKADGTPVDPDCTSGCTKTGGNCCLPVVDGGCDSDCPAGFDPDCSADIFFCGDRSFQEANKWPAVLTIPYSDDVNYPYEKGIPNGADSCVAPLVRFKALSPAGDVDPPRIARQYRIPRTYSLKQRRWSRGDVFLESQVSDFEGSDLKLGLMFSTEQSPWVDPASDAWYCSTSKKTAFWCAVSFVSEETAADQPLVPAEPAPLPLPYAVYPVALPPPPPHPSVDNEASPGRIGPAVQRIGVTTPIKTRQWLDVNTGWDSDYLSTTAFYWATAPSTYGNIRGAQTEGDQTGEPLDDRRQALWLELVSTDSGGCTETTNSGCFSSGGNVISLCDSSCYLPPNVGAWDDPTDCQSSCVLADAETKTGWSRRQRLVVDLKPGDLDTSGPEPDAIQTLTVSVPSGSGPWVQTLTWGPRPSIGTDPSTGLATVGGEVLKDTADDAFQSQYASWSPGKAHYEIWYGTNKDEVRPVALGQLVCTSGGGSIISVCTPVQSVGESCGTGVTCQENDGDATNGPFVWEDIPQANSGLPRETCTWDTPPLGNLDGDCYDSKLADIYCTTISPSLCNTTITTNLGTSVYFLVCAVDDFGNYEKSCKFSESSPWVQTKFGDIYAGASLTATNQSVVPNATFLITTAGSISNWSSASTAFGSGGKLEQYNRLAPSPYTTQRDLPFPTYKNDFTTTAGSIWFLRGYDGAGNNFNTAGGVLDQLRARYGNNRVRDLSTMGLCDNTNDGTTLPAVLDGTVYFMNGNCIINQDNIQFDSDGTLGKDGSGLFLINGNLTLKKNLQYKNPPTNAPTKLKHIASATWLVLGGVTIDPAVTTVDSSIIALGKWDQRNLACNNPAADAVACGTISTGTAGASDVLLKVRGIMAAREFLFQRTGSELLIGSETIIYDGRLLANPPPGLDDLMQSLPVWK